MLLQIVLLPVSLIVFAGMCWVMLSIVEALGSMIGRALGISLDQYERFVGLVLSIGVSIGILIVLGKGLAKLWELVSS